MRILRAAATSGGRGLGLGAVVILGRCMAEKREVLSVSTAGVVIGRSVVNDRVGKVCDVLNRAARLPHAFANAQTSLIAQWR